MKSHAKEAVPCSKKVRLALQRYGAKGVRKWCFDFYHPSSSVLQQSGCWKLREFWLLIEQNYAGITPLAGVTSLAAKEVRFQSVKRATRTDFIAKKKNYSILTNHYFRSITRNTTIELVLQHLMFRLKLHVLPYLICVDQIEMNPLVSILLSKHI